ncbi:26133_t:CDS:2, partial [Racocetra persica]
IDMSENNKISEDAVTNSKPMPPTEGSVDINEWSKYRNELERYLSLEPINWDLVLLDNLLSKYSEEATLENFKKYFEAISNGKTIEESEKGSAKEYHRKSKKAISWKSTNISKTSLSEKDMDISIINEFVKIR